MDTLEGKAILTKIAANESRIIALKKETSELKGRFKDLKKRKFFEEHTVDALLVLQKYATRLDKCCYQGGAGYSIWLPKELGISDHCHWVVEPSKYTEAQPTLVERDAYFVIYDSELYVTQKIHTEYWGN